MPELRITRAGEQDLSRIVQLAWQIWPEWYDAVIGPEQLYFMLDQLYQEDALRQKQQAGQLFCIIQQGRNDAGFFAVRNPAGDSARLENLYLLKDYRGKGFGKLMLGRVEEISLSCGKNTLECNVNRFNPVLSFYQHNGFSIREQADIPFGPFFLNDFIMVKRLRAGLKGG